jgi:hypothetical protein
MQCDEVYAKKPARVDDLITFRYFEQTNRRS